MNYKEALEAGYKRTRSAYQRGYISRKTNIDEQPVLSTKRGDLYVILPCYSSSQYSIRQYIVTPETKIPTVHYNSLGVLVLD